MEVFFLFFLFFNLRRMGKNKALLAHHTSTYFHTRRVSIKLSCFRNPTLEFLNGKYMEGCPTSVKLSSTSMVSLYYPWMLPPTLIMEATNCSSYLRSSNFRFSYMGVGSTFFHWRFFILLPRTLYLLLPCHGRKSPIFRISMKVEQ